MGILFGNAQGGGGGSAPVVTGANNGTSLVGTNIQLGGNPLIANTTIDMAGFALLIEDSTTGSSWAFTPNTFNINLMEGGVTTQMVVMEPGELVFSNTEPGTGNLEEIAMSGGSIILTVDDAVPESGSIGLNMIDPNGQGKVFAFSNQVFMSWQASGLTQEIDFQASGMTVTDQVNVKGLVYGADYSAVGLIDNRWIPDLGGVKNLLSTLGFPQIKLNNINQAIIAGGGGVLTYTPPGSGTGIFRVSPSASFSAIGAGIVISVNYTDSLGNARSIVVATLTAVISPVNPVTLQVTLGNVISVTYAATTATGTLAACVESL